MTPSVLVLQGVVLALLWFQKVFRSDATHPPTSIPTRSLLTAMVMSPVPEFARLAHPERVRMLRQDPKGYSSGCYDGFGSFLAYTIRGSLACSDGGM